jgi:outer membrane beta-barrel protein
MRGPRRRCLLAALGVLGLLVAGRPAAADEAARIGQGPRVFAIQPRPFRLGHEFQLGAGVLPLDAFYVGVVPAASYTYHFTDFWAWEIASVGYSQNFSTSLEGDLKESYGLRPQSGDIKHIQLFGTTSLVIKPLFGKLAVFNRDIVQSETFFVLGLGGLLLEGHFRPTVDFGLGLRFWSTETLSVRFDLRDYLIFVQLLPQHALFGMLSVAFNFVNSPAKAAAEAAQ